MKATETRKRGRRHRVTNVPRLVGWEVVVKKIVMAIAAMGLAMSLMTALAGSAHAQAYGYPYGYGAYAPADPYAQYDPYYELHVIHYQLYLGGYGYYSNPYFAPAAPVVVAPAPFVAAPVRQSVRVAPTPVRRR